MDIDRAISIGLPVSRAIHMAACLVALGVLAFDRVIVVHAARQAGAEFVDRCWPPIARMLILVAFPVALLSGAGWYACSLVTMTGLPPREAFQADNLRDFAATQFAVLWQQRVMIFLAAALCALPAIVLRRGTKVQSASTWLALICAGALALSIARAGHGADFTRVHQTADAVHMVIGAAWPAGLLPLALLLRNLRRHPAPQRWTTTFVVTNRFSAMSLVSVVALSSSGVVNSLPLIGSWQFLFSSAYGRILLVKVGLLGLMVFIGSINLIFLRPRLSPQADAGDARRQRALNWLRFNVWLEVLLSIGVIAAVGWLGTMEPACCALP